MVCFNTVSWEARQRGKVKGGVVGVPGGNKILVVGSGRRSDRRTEQQRMYTEGAGQTHRQTNGQTNRKISRRADI